MTSPRWWSRKPQPLFPHIDQQLDSYSSTKTALGESGVQVRNFSNTVEQTKNKQTKHLRVTAQKEKEEQFHFVRIISSPRMALLSAKRELPSWKEVPMLGKEKRGEWSAFPGFWDTAQRIHISFTLPRDQQSWDIERRLGTKKRSG